MSYYYHRHPSAFPGPIRRALLIQKRAVASDFRRLRRVCLTHGLMRAYPAGLADNYHYVNLERGGAAGCEMADTQKPLTDRLSMVSTKAINARGNAIKCDPPTIKRERPGGGGQTSRVGGGSWSTDSGRAARLSSPEHVPVPRAPQGRRKNGQWPDLTRNRTSWLGCSMRLIEDWDDYKCYRQVPDDWEDTREVPDDLAQAYLDAEDAMYEARHRVSEYVRAVARDDRPEPEAARYWAQLERGRRKHYRRARPTTEGDTK